MEIEKVMTDFYDLFVTITVAIVPDTILGSEPPFNFNTEYSSNTPQK